MILQFQLKSCSAHMTLCEIVSHGIDEISCLNNLMKYLHLPSHSMDEEKANH